MRTPLMTLIAAAVVALGVAVAGLFIGRGFVAARTGDRSSPSRAWRSAR